HPFVSLFFPFGCGRVRTAFCTLKKDGSPCLDLVPLTKRGRPCFRRFVEFPAAEKSPALFGPPSGSKRSNTASRRRAHTSPSSAITAPTTPARRPSPTSSKAGAPI